MTPRPGGAIPSGAEDAAPSRVDDVAPSRLLGLRLQGFKSFADRTVVEFGAGISAVVGPNGSGKSNLADALRWALGEQGRSLRTRKSEDVIFAGSERRAALGMADVTLVLDNADGLLPVEYSVIEIGRRLFRSGENDYLLNKQRVRLRDLVDLLDAAHLADNAFLFIGQGMVDQALALRPEERRPLFEEVAGVRRHERRRRKAEEQLVEAEANLARVDDILAELRPQARRLAAQAEQQATRESAAVDLAEAIVRSTHHRWHAASARARDAAAALAANRQDVDAALGALQEAERGVDSIGTDLAGRAPLAQERIAAHDEARSASMELRLRAARLAAEGDGIARDRQRLNGERASAEADLASRRRELASPSPLPDADRADDLASAERNLAEALEAVGSLRASTAVRSDATSALRRAEAASRADLDAARRRSRDVERDLAEERAEAERTEGRRAETEARLAAARHALEVAVAEEGKATERLVAGRAELERAEGLRRVAEEQAASLAGRLATARGRFEAVEAQLRQDEARGIARAARRVGGRRVDEELRVDPTFRAALEAVLADALRAYAVRRHDWPAVAGERGMIVLDGSPASRPGPAEPAVRSLLDRVTALGGGTLAGAVRRDPTGAAGRLLASVVWLPDLESAVEVQRLLPLGWLAVPRDGSGVVGPVTIALGPGSGLLERRDEAARLAAEVSALTEQAGAAVAAQERATATAATRRTAFENARAAEAWAVAVRRRAEDEERSAARDAERSGREAAWHAAQVARLAADATRLAADETRLGEALAGLEASADRDRPGEPALDDATADGQAFAGWERRVRDLQAVRDRRAADVAERDRVRREWERTRARAEAAAALDEERIARVDREARLLGDREQVLEEARLGLGEELAAAAAREERARAELDEVRAADAADRERLAEAERHAAHARDRLRLAEDRLRGGEVVDLEARLALDSIREQVLVELAGLAGIGLRLLQAAAVPDGGVRAGAVPAGAPSAGAVPAGAPSAGEATSQTIEEGADEDTASLEAALDAAAARWAVNPPPGDSPSPARMTSLRRRYHELGAANPYAVEEYAELRQRVESLQAQHADLRTAIARTRSLIEDLDRMVAQQFQATFRALEAAFDARFRQLFGGGFARLSLTDPGDLAATGVEIVARPPGKKAQALAMLSGGERALTAVALLFAMLEVRPVPFCVLDEVDAALDEANVGRFSEALRSLARQTQFIVITHNRGTIEAADALYGVTVGDDSVSRVISLRLEEAQDLADRTREARVDVLAG